MNNTELQQLKAIATAAIGESDDDWYSSDFLRQECNFSAEDSIFSATSKPSVIIRLIDELIDARAALASQASKGAVEYLTIDDLPPLIGEKESKRYGKDWTDGFNHLIRQLRAVAAYNSTAPSPVEAKPVPDSFRYAQQMVVEKMRAYDTIIQSSTAQGEALSQAELRHVDEIIRMSDQSVRIRFMSARAASEFEQTIRALAAKPVEVKS